jgi:hypothetical protein
VGSICSQQMQFLFGCWISVAEFHSVDRRQGTVIFCFIHSLVTNRPDSCLKGAAVPVATGRARVACLPFYLVTAGKVHTGNLTFGSKERLMRRRWKSSVTSATHNYPISSKSAPSSHSTRNLPAGVGTTGRLQSREVVIGKLMGMASDTCPAIALGEMPAFVEALLPLEAPNDPSLRAFLSSLQARVSE